jgi:GT2 family glycosyltransferase
MTSISIVIVSYNTRALLDACLSSVAATTAGLDIETVVVDNASTDGSVEMLSTHHPQVEVVRLRENVGFARAVNLAAERARGDWLLLLNPDTVVHPGAVEALFGFAVARPGAGIVGGRTLRPDGSTDPSSCWGAPTLWSTICFALGLSTAFRGNRLLDPESLGSWRRDTIRPVDVVTGCLLMTSRQVWDALEGFDPNFFMYGEDVDLCLRARALGFEPAITPDATITHVVGASSTSSSAKRRLVLTGKATLTRKHVPPPTQHLHLSLLKAGVAGRALLEQLFRGAERSWSDAWFDRARWTAGYPAAPPPVATTHRSVT